MASRDGTDAPTKTFQPPEVGWQVELAGIGWALEPMEPALGLDLVADLSGSAPAHPPHSNPADDLVPACRRLDLLRFEVECGGWVRGRVGQSTSSAIAARLGQDTAANRRENAIRADHVANIPRVRPLIREQTNCAEACEAQHRAIGESARAEGLRDGGQSQARRRCHDGKSEARTTAITRHEGRIDCAAVDPAGRCRHQAEGGRNRRGAHERRRRPPRQLLVNQGQFSLDLVHVRGAFYSGPRQRANLNRPLAVLYIGAMTRELTAFEVLEIAEKMERDAARFYRKAAGMYNDAKISKLFAELAQWEKRHIQVFADMKDRFTEQAWELGRFDLDRVDAARLDVPPAVFDEYSDPAKELTGNETRADVLKLAIKKERHTIGYYTALTEFTLGQDNIEVVKAVIEEEKRHVRILVQSLSQTAG